VELPMKVSVWKARSCLVALVAIVIGAALAPASATAGVLSEGELFSFGEYGSGAGQIGEGTFQSSGELITFFSRRSSIATDPTTGHVYLAETDNNRIDEFTAWGEFVKSWGWGVRDGSPELQTCTEQSGCQGGIDGSGTGQIEEPTGIGVAPDGDIYVYEAGNHRLQAFDPEGHFVRSVGGDVIGHGPGNSTNDETQEVTVASSSGTFKLSLVNPYGGKEEKQTTALPFNASAAEVEAALNGLTTIGGLGGSVTVTGGPGSPTGSAPYEITFEGNLSGDDVPRLKIDRTALGPATIGARLVCSIQTEAENESLTYEWLRNGVPIGGATAQTYVTTAADEGKAVQCLAAVHRAEAGAAQAALPAYVAPPKPGTALPVAPQASFESSTVQVAGNESLPVGGSGATLECKPKEQNWQNASSFSYTWYRDGERIEGAASQEYTATPADVANPAAFQCGVTATNAGGSITDLSNGLATNPGPRDSLDSSTYYSPSVSMEPVRTLVQGGGPEVCSAAAGDTCKVGRRGTAGGEFALETSSSSPVDGDNLDIATDGTLYLGDWGRIQKFDAATGAFESSLPLARSLWFPDYPMPQAISLGPEENIFVAFRGTLGTSAASAYRLGPSGSKLYALPISVAESIAASPDGVAYTSDRPETYEDTFPRLREVDSTGVLAATCCVLEYNPSVGENRSWPGMATNVVTAAGGVDLYVVNYNEYPGHSNEASIRVFGPPPDKWSPPVAPPSVGAQYARSVGEESAVLGADINPNFWADTHYRVEYGAVPCFEGGCKATGERQLGAGIVKKNVATKGVVLSDLEPATTYHYRFVAESSGGGPIYGPDRTFTTFAVPRQPDSTCPNQELRTGPSGSLSDCRAYEMASPVNKNGADLSTFLQLNGLPARLDQGSVSGEGVPYSASAAFGGAEGGPYSSQYLSTRGAGGWSTRNISPPQESGSVYTTQGLDIPFRAFSEDLSSGWLVTGGEPQLAPGALEGFGNLYREDTSGSYEALTTVAPPGVRPENSYPTLLGFSADGTRSFFRAVGKLTEDAAPSTSIEQVYEAHEGQLHLVSVKPNGSAATVSSTVGTPATAFDNGREVNIATAISEDGRLVYWTEGGSKLYLRIEGAETVAVSGTKTATFRAASTDGEKALYEEEGQLKRFDAETRTSSTLVNGGMVGVMGVSHDLSRVYFASSQELAEGATAGKPNLYLYEDEQPLRFIATLGAEEMLGDMSHAVPAVALDPLSHFSRVTPDGKAAIFMSTAALAGAENLDSETGKADAQVFRYDAETEELACISCSPTGARPTGEALSGKNGGETGYFYAAKIPGAELSLHYSRVLSTNGDRVFFDSVDRLVPTDTNGRQDVYQWEAEGEGECTGPDAPGYDQASGGCLSLISDGRGSTPAEFIDASADGSNAFFFTGTSLLPQDPGQVDVYDARVDGGFPQPPELPAQCEGEACQSPISPPNEPPNSSEVYHGPGNPKPQAAQKKHKKAKKHTKKHKKARRKARSQSEKTGGKR
jgi:hypothetical protein